MNMPQEHIDRVKNTVAEFYGVTIAEIESRRRPQRIAWPRMVIMFLLIESGATCEHVGAILKRKHGTGSHAQRTVGNAIDCYPEIRQQITTLRKKLSLL